MFSYVTLRHIASHTISYHIVLHHQKIQAQFIIIIILIIIFLVVSHHHHYHHQRHLHRYSHPQNDSPVQHQGLNTPMEVLAPHQHLLAMGEAEGVELPADVDEGQVLPAGLFLKEPLVGVSLYADQSGDVRKGLGSVRRGLYPDQAPVLFNCVCQHTS